MPKHEKITKSQRKALDKEHVTHIINGGFDTGAVLDYDPKHPTAYWKFENGRHEIIIGENLYDIVTAAKPTARAGLLKSVYRHERGHALYTARDLKKIDELCKDAGVPFKLLNLFEDARIEDLYRKQHKTYFRWANWIEPPPAQKPDALALFYRFKLLENHRSLKKRTSTGDEFVVWPVDGQNNGSAYSIWWFFRRTTRARSTAAVIDIVKEFMERFGITADDAENNPVIGSNQGDMESALDESDQPLIDSEGTSQAGPDAEDTSPDPANAKGTGTSAAASKQKDSNDAWPKDQQSRGYAPIIVDETAANAIAHALDGLHADGNGHTLAEAGDAIYMPSLATLQLDNLFEAHAHSTKGKPKVLVLTDMSGSMQGDPINAAATLNVGIAKSDAVDSAHIFTSEAGSRRFEQHEVKTAIFRDAASNSGQEGIADYTKRHAAELTQYDIILCLTDGDLTGRPLDWSFLELRGISRIAAVYVGPYDQSKELERYFRRHLSVRTVLDAAPRIKQLLR